jgi:hypothetical protein
MKAKEGTWLRFMLPQSKGNAIAASWNWAAKTMNWQGFTRTEH